MTKYLHEIINITYIKKDLNILKPHIYKLFNQLIK